MPELVTAPWPLVPALAVFAVAVLVTVLGGVRLSMAADVLADRTGWGEALFGAVVFGALTSLSGIVMTATAAAGGYPAMAYGNAVGGVAAQTAALAVADMTYRKANLEHAAASVANMASASLLVVLLCFVVLGSLAPEWTVLSLHPASLVLVLAYLGGFRVVRSVRETPLWKAVSTPQTDQDEPDEQAPESTGRLLAELIVLGILVAGAGWAVARASESFLVHSALQESFVGAVVMGLANALPEIVTSVAAVRRGALTLAVGVVLGGNAFDVLNVAVGDVFYRGGSLYHAAATDGLFMTVAAIAMTAVLILGMLRREKHGVANIGTESATVLLLWVAATLVLAF